MTKQFYQLLIMCVFILRPELNCTEDPPLVFSEWTVVNLTDCPYIKTKNITFNNHKQHLTLITYDRFFYDNKQIPTGKIAIRMNYDTTFALHNMLHNHKFPVFLKSPHSSHLLEIRRENIKKVG